MSARKLRVLLLENSAADAGLIEREVRKVANVTIASNRADFMRYLAQPWDVFLADLALTDIAGTEAIHIAREKYPNMPVAIVTGSVSAKQADAACDSGARRFFMKELDGIPGLARGLLQMHEESRLKAVADMEQRNSALGQLTTGVAHDGNNNLQVIIGGVSYLSTRINPMDVFVLEKVETAAKHLAELLKQLTNFAKGVNGGEHKMLTADYLLTDLGILLRATFPKNIIVETFIVPGTSTLVGDAAQLKSALLNLAINARDAMPNGGILRIEAMNATRVGELSGEFVCFCIEDTGHGIPEDVLTRIWDMFFTTKGSKGSGIGLSQVRGAVTAHGGTVEVESVPGRTVFSVYLPAADPKAASNKPAFDGAGKTVLAVDDEEGMRFLLPIQLQQAGFKTLVASHGIEALAHFRTGATIDLVLSDWSMPLMNGMELADALRGQGFKVPILLVTGHDAGNVGPFSVLKKPFTQTELVEACQKALAGVEGQP